MCGCWVCEGRAPRRGWTPPRVPSNTASSFPAKEQVLWIQEAFLTRCAKSPWVPTFRACSVGRNVCYGKDAENNHIHVCRNHTHTAEDKQNYSCPKYLRVESLRKASNLCCRSKIGIRGWMEGQISVFRSPGSIRKKKTRLPDLGSTSLPGGRIRRDWLPKTVFTLWGVHKRPAHMTYVTRHFVYFTISHVLY